MCLRVLRISAVNSALQSVYALPISEVIAMAHDVTASRVLDVVLQSPSVPMKEKRKFVMNFIGHYHTLVDERIGSRVGDNCWAFADPYLRVCYCLLLPFPTRVCLLTVYAACWQEKIARSLIPHERALTSSFYGKFFARNLNLYLLQRDPEQWKTSQMNLKAAAASSSHTGSSDKVQRPPLTDSASGDAGKAREREPQAEGSDSRKPRKRKVRMADEIDQLFEEKLGKKTKRAGLNDDPTVKAAAKSGDDRSGEKRKRRDNVAEDNGLEEVLGAIKAAPKDKSGHRSKKKK